MLNYKHRQQFKIVLQQSKQKMFKQAKNTAIQQPYQLGQSVHQDTPKTQCQTLPKQLLQFISRQLTILKDIAQSCSTVHPNIVSNRLYQCVHLIEKKMTFSLSSNPEQYHDYIQDFYQNQLSLLRGELNTIKIQATKKNKQIQQLTVNNQMLIKERQGYLDFATKSHMQSSRLYKHSNIEQIQENKRLKKQLDHCRILIQQNSSFIQQQAKAIQLLSGQLRQKQKQLKAMREKYQQKVLKFDQFVNKTQNQVEYIIRNLTSEHKNYQAQLKEISISKIRMVQERSHLQKQLQMKMEEIQLLTKKVLEDQIMLGKLEKTVVLKQKLIQQLYLQIDSVNGNLSRIGRKEGDFHRTFIEKNEQITKLQQRIKIINETNQKLQKNLNNSIKKIEQLKKQNLQSGTQLQKSQQIVGRLRSQLQGMQAKLQQSQKQYSKLYRQKDRVQQQLKSRQEKLEEIVKKNKQEKQAVRKEIMVEVNQLVTIVGQKDNLIKQLIKQKQQLEGELKVQRQNRFKAEESHQKINNMIGQIQLKLNGLRNQNKQLNETKTILENELIKMTRQIQKLSKFEQLYQKIGVENKVMKDELECLRKIQSEAVHTQKNIDKVFEKKQNQLYESFSDEKKQLKEIISKKQFQIKQLESKVKILQEQLRDSSKLFENEKFRMNLKIKQLQQLLKQRYDFSSRFSQPSDGGI